MSDEARDESIARAARAFRDESHGRSSESDATRARILATRRRDTERSTLWLAAAAALVLGLGVPTAWAWSTGRLATWLDGAPASDAQRDAPAVETPTPERPAPLENPEVERVDPATDPAIDPVVDPMIDPLISPDPDRGTESTAREPSSPDPVVDPAERRAPPAEVHPLDEAPLMIAPGDDSTPVDPEERLAFQHADALHTARDASAVEAWDAYLTRYPQGRFAIEARYARAICLARLGRTDEARAALAPFADGRFGRYREGEAAALLEALDE